MVSPVSESASTCLSKVRSLIRKRSLTPFSFLALDVVAVYGTGTTGTTRKLQRARCHISCHEIKGDLLWREAIQLDSWHDVFASDWGPC